MNDGPSTVTCRCARCDTEVIVTAVAYASFRFNSMGILCERHLNALRDSPPPHSPTGRSPSLGPNMQGIILHTPEFSQIRDAFMVRWLTGIGEFDTNDPCDE